MANPSPSETLLTELALVLRQTREEAGLSKRELAQRAGCITTTITRLESGVQNPGLELLTRISFALHTQPSHLLARAESRVNLKSEEVT
ncbi:helix-turn-helix domain-containing protein [Roseibacillus ishigakijimensis]|uniref:Helix-turn-helix transcriptional regulator n=1 Tax=Roseibacillus ishigakijimensis TaxID=454146 RepID=A0A934RN84_9BACT|nr:helix-turn-helix transcriptional regulator [Roseibacillus ishigakijimensis]MBK1832481.1 helix-turn-helix transcriptional regulator [Roseibacillus ishigakijimensis]